MRKYSVSQTLGGNMEYGKIKKFMRGARRRVESLLYEEKRRQNERLGLEHGGQTFPTRQKNETGFNFVSIDAANQLILKNAPRYNPVIL